MLIRSSIIIWDKMMKILNNVLFGSLRLFFGFFERFLTRLRVIIIYVIFWIVCHIIGYMHTITHLKKTCKIFEVYDLVQ